MGFSRQEYWSGMPVPSPNISRYFSLILFFSLLFIYLLFCFYFTILYWFCHTSTCIHHGCTHIPHPDPLPPPHTIPLGHPSALIGTHYAISVQFSSVQSLSSVRLFATPWFTARQASLSITNSWSSLRLTSIESVMPFSHLILCRPLLLRVTLVLILYLMTSSEK